MSDQNDTPEEEFISKTQRKKHALELQDLARELADMPAGRLAQLVLPEALLKGLQESRRITSHIARKRHFQYLGKLLLKSDHNAILEQLEAMQNRAAAFNVRDAFYNRWCDALIQDDAALDRLYSSHEPRELNALRDVLRVLKKTPEKTSARKKLYRQLRTLDAQTPLPLLD